MAQKPSKEIMDFMELYGVESDEIWQVHGTSWVIKHKALERVAAEKGVVWGVPTMIETKMADGMVAMCVFGRLGERSEWSIGEASPKNNKNAYPYAMAEKRAKDRVILKLLSLHGELYSEDEAEELKRPNPHVTRPADVFEPVEHDQNGEVIDNIPRGEAPAKRLTVVQQRPIFEALQKEAHAFTESKKFLAWMNAETTIARVADIKPDWQEMFRGLCKEHLISLRDHERADDMRMAG
jgi:hypothetical protein